MMDLAQTFQTGAALYGCLWGLYTYPLRQEAVTALLKLESADPRLEERLVFLRSVLEEVADWDAFLEHLDVEYTRLFVGPGQNPAPPYASFYLNGGSLIGPETLAVRSAYLEWGMAPVQLDRVPDDHIALELCFMGYLNGETHTALTEGDDRRLGALLEAQASFLSDHLLTWVPRFCADAASATRDEFFIGLSGLTQTHLENDAELLAELVATRTEPFSVPNA